jgi:hypothetical protein
VTGRTLPQARDTELPPHPDGKNASANAPTPAVQRILSWKLTSLDYAPDDRIVMWASVPQMTPELAVPARAAARELYEAIDGVRVPDDGATFDL